MALLAFILPRWKWLIGGLAIGVAALTIMILRADVRHFQKLWTAEKTAHALDIANYKAASDEAARLDKANVVRVTKEQTAITEKVTNDYQSKLADSTSRYDRLRAQASGYLSHPASPGVPADPQTTCIAVSGASCEEIPTLMLEAQRNTDQLLALQAWVQGQSAIDNNAAP